MVQLLNTVSNLGGTWPKYFVLKGIDAFSVAVCHVKDENLDLVVASASPPILPFEPQLSCD